MNERFKVAVEDGHNSFEQDFVTMEGDASPSVCVGYIPNEGEMSIAYNVSIVLSSSDYNLFAQRAYFYLSEVDDITYEEEILQQVNFLDLNYDYPVDECDYEEFCFQKIDLGTFVLDGYYLSWNVVYPGSEGPDDVVAPCPTTFLDCVILEPVSQQSRSINNDSSGPEYINGTTDDGLKWSPLN